MALERLAATALILVLAPCARAGMHGKKLIEYGWDRPPTSYVREHVTEMERIPFDGVVMTIPAPKDDPNKNVLGIRAFGSEKLTPHMVQPAIDDLKVTRFRRFTDNFVQLTVSPGSVDWFDPNWSTIAGNAGLFARIAKQGRCKGIMFDPEPYVDKVWTYIKFSEDRRKAHTFEEYKVKVRERGREFMTAINKEYPDITILCLFGPCGGFHEVGTKPPEERFFGMLNSFYQGMLDVASPQTIIVDGYEFAYSFRAREQFVQARKSVLTEARKQFDDPKEFDKHIRMGFGNWTDYNWQNIDWSAEDFSRNYFSPEALRFSLYHALDVSDRYVWVYSQKLKWWNERNAPQAYVDALALAKQGPGPGDPNPPPQPK